jgi:hypothetical protein
MHPSIWAVVRCWQGRESDLTNCHCPFCFSVEPNAGPPCVQSPFLLGRLSDTYIKLAIGMGNREMIDSAEGEVVLHALSRQSHWPSDI